MLSLYYTSKVILVTSKKERKEGTDHTEPPNEKILRDAIEVIKNHNAIDSGMIEIEVLRMNYMWDFFEYAQKLGKIEGNEGILNLSAGPAAFSFAALVLSITKNYMVAYSIENRKYNEPEPNVIFRQFSITPYMNYVFKTDQADKEIIKAVISGCKKSSEIREQLLKSDFNYSLRTIETRVMELKRKKIFHISGGKIYNISLAEVVEKIISNNFQENMWSR